MMIAGTDFFRYGVVPLLLGLVAIALIAWLHFRKGGGNLIWSELWMVRDWFDAEPCTNWRRVTGGIVLVVAATVTLHAALRLGAPGSVLCLWVAAFMAALWWGSTPSANFSHLLARRGDVAALERALREQHMDVGASDRLHRTPLHYAAAAGEVDALRWLLEHGADVDAPGRRGIRALHLAAWHGMPGALETLTANGADVDARTADGSTALHWAAEQGFARSVRILLQAGADADVPDARGRKPADLAERRGHRALAEAIRTRSAHSWRNAEKVSGEYLPSDEAAREANRRGISRRERRLVGVLMVPIGLGFAICFLVVSDESIIMPLFGSATAMRFVTAAFGCGYFLAGVFRVRTRWNPLPERWMHRAALLAVVIVLVSPGSLEYPSWRTRIMLLAAWLAVAAIVRLVRRRPEK